MHEIATELGQNDPASLAGGALIRNSLQQNWLRDHSIRVDASVGIPVFVKMPLEAVNPIHVMIVADVNELIALPACGWHVIWVGP